jgi:hypothetical protein
MKTEIKAAETLHAKLTKKYESAPDQTIGSIICSVELVIQQLKKLDEK